VTIPHLSPLDPASTTVLFGAGITRDAGGPAAADLIDEIGEAFVVEGKWRDWLRAAIQPEGQLRFEVAMEELSSLADPELKALSFLSEMRPGPLHRALAEVACRGARLATVNFDTMQEAALVDAGRDPWTVDLQQKVNIDRITDPGAVVKLHGSQGHHNGSDRPDPSDDPLQATIRAIVEAGGGAGLAPEVELRLLSLVAGRTLLVVGYSGLDGLDVMPSLAKSEPARVIWIKHEEEALPPQSLEDIAEPGVRALLCELRDRGIEVEFHCRPTIGALRGLGWKVEGALDDDEQAAISASWRKSIQHWAREAQQLEPTGLAWIGVLLTSTGRVEDAREAMIASLPSSLHDVPWSAQWRLQEIAENAYHCDLDFDLVREEAEQAQAVAAAREDHDCVAACHHLISRTRRVGDPQDLDAAEREWYLARAALDEIAPVAREADLQLEWARLRIARSAYSEAAEAALEAAEMFRSQGLLRLESEATQVAGHAFTLDGQARQKGIELILKAREAARRGPYPEREIAACLALSTAYDELGETAESDVACEEAIRVTLKTDAVGEISQAYSSLGLGRSELGDFAGAAEAFEGAFNSLTPATRYQKALIACGLADAQFHLGNREKALMTLRGYEAPIQAAPIHRVHSAALHWAMGRESEEDFVRLAAKSHSDLKPVGQLAFALARLHAPGPHIAAYLRHCEQLIERGEQWKRLERFRGATGSVRT
jgi:tetratricopeptide (TPR) repeat protein